AGRAGARASVPRRRAVGGKLSPPVSEKNASGNASRLQLRMPNQPPNSLTTLKGVVSRERHQRFSQVSICSWLIFLLPWNWVWGPPGASFIRVKLRRTIPSRRGSRPIARRTMYLVMRTGSSSWSRRSFGSVAVHVYLCRRCWCPSIARRQPMESAAASHRFRTLLGDEPVLGVPLVRGGPRVLEEVPKAARHATHLLAVVERDFEDLVDVDDLLRSEEHTSELQSL